MHIRIRLLLMQEIERRNQEHIEAYENQRKGSSKKRKKKPIGIRASPRNGWNSRCNAPQRL